MMVISLSWRSLGDHNLSAGCPVDPGHRLFQRDGEAPEISHSKHFKSYWNILNFCVLIWIYIYICICIYYIYVYVYVYVYVYIFKSCPNAQCGYRTFCFGSFSDPYSAPFVKALQNALRRPRWTLTAGATWRSQSTTPRQLSRLAKRQERELHQESESQTTEIC